jgi:hypothetical protein
VSVWSGKVQKVVMDLNTSKMAIVLWQREDFVSGYTCTARLTEADAFGKTVWPLDSNGKFRGGRVGDFEVIERGVGS